MLDLSAVTNAILAEQVSDKAKQEAAVLVEGWINRFYQEDQTFTVKQVEREMYCYLDYRTMLVGRVDLPDALDAQGVPFFGEWKSGRMDKDWRVKWRMSAQAMTYGVLTNRGVYTTQTLDEKPAANNRFLVRYAFKLKTPDYDQEWFSYTDGELNFWEEQLIETANVIRGRRHMEQAPWPINPSRCFKYGKDYVCPFFEDGCSKLAFNNTTGFAAKVSHLEFEKTLPTSQDFVVLDATRVGEYLDCNEKYRKEYEERLQTSSNHSLQVGTAFHRGLGCYYEQIRK